MAQDLDKSCLLIQKAMILISWLRLNWEDNFFPNSLHLYRQNNLHNNLARLHASIVKGSLPHLFGSLTRYSTCWFIPFSLHHSLGLSHCVQPTFHPSVSNQNLLPDLIQSLVPQNNQPKKMLKFSMLIKRRPNLLSQTLICVVHLLTKYCVWHTPDTNINLL